MLSALIEDTGEKIYSFSSPEFIVRPLSKQKKLICPHCRDLLVYHHGLERIAHFKHKNTCIYETEPETQEHKIGKILLKERLEKLYPRSKVDMEVRIEETNQISDVLVIHPNGERWAFEYQCARISAQKWLERHQLYEEAEISDFWILGYDNFYVGDYGSLQRTLENEQGYVYHLYNQGSKEKLEIPYNRFIKRKNLSGFDIESMIVKKHLYNNQYFIDDIEGYEKSLKDYKEMKDKLYRHLKDLYKSANVEKDSYIDNIQEKVDILIESSKGGKSIFIFEGLNKDKEKWINKMKKLNKSDYIVFWFVIDNDLFIESTLYETMRKQLDILYTYDNNLNIIIPYKKKQKSFKLDKLGIMKGVESFELVNMELEGSRRIDYEKREVKYKKAVCPKCKKPLRLWLKSTGFRGYRYGTPLLTCSDYKKCRFEEELEDILCPECNLPMRLIYSEKYNQYFWSCSIYPRCNFSLKISF